MPSYPCRAPNCPAYVDRRRGYCADHAGLPSARAETNRLYDQRNRDQAAKQFYNSARWLRARARKLQACPVCQRCQREWASHVHHVIPLAECTHEQQVDQDNLLSACPACHTIIEAERKTLYGNPKPENERLPVDRPRPDEEGEDVRDREQAGGEVDRPRLGG